MKTLNDALTDLPEDHHIFRIGEFFIPAKTQRQAELHYIAEHVTPVKILKAQWPDILRAEIEALKNGTETDERTTD